MNTYEIAPKVVRISLDKELSKEFFNLDKRLQWRPLTLNVDCCEEEPYLYFRIALKLRAESTTYAGFSTGAPFMLTRDIEVKKRAFFLRHWIRQPDPSQKLDVPVVLQKHLTVGAQDNRLLVRVEIDRPLDPNDTFKSVPFATVMFQIVQVDAIIEEMRHVQFAFAIERTVTSEERETLSSRDRKPLTSTVMKGSSVASGRTDVGGRMQSTAQSKTTGASIAPRKAPAAAQFIKPVSGFQRPVQRSPVQAPQVHQSAIFQRSPSFSGGQPLRQNIVTARQLPSTYQHNPYNYISSRQVPMQMRQTVSPRPSAAAVQSPSSVRPSSRNSIRTSNAISVSQSQYTPVVTTTPHYSGIVENAKANTHPDVRLWEEHDANDPYEPFFITEDTNFEEKARKNIILDHASEREDRFDHNNLFGFSASDYPWFYVSGPAIVGDGDEADIEIELENTRENRGTVFHRQGLGHEIAENGIMGRSDEGKELAAAVAAATDYNKTLSRERRDLQQWLVEDAERQEQKSEIEDDDDDGDSISE